MKIQFMSDLHITQWQAYARDQIGNTNWWQEVFLKSIVTDADVLVLAGDIVSLEDGMMSWSRGRIEEFCALYKHVVFVPGNHEFWGTSIADGWENLVDLETIVPGLHVLPQFRSIQIDGRWFRGGTMWQPHKGSLWEASRKQFADGRYIGNFWNEAPANFESLMTHLEALTGPDDVVITHHAPSMQSVDTPWIGHRDNRFFITPEAEERIIKPKQPALWIHGHVHSTWDYQIGKTRVVANPFGYPGEGVRFEPKKIIELP